MAFQKCRTTFRVRRTFFLCRLFVAGDGLCRGLFPVLRTVHHRNMESLMVHCMSCITTKWRSYEHTIVITFTPFDPSDRPDHGCWDYHCEHGGFQPILEALRQGQAARDFGIPGNQEISAVRRIGFVAPDRVRRWDALTLQWSFSRPAVVPDKDDVHIADDRKWGHARQDNDE